MDQALQHWAETRLRQLDPGARAPVAWQPLRVEASHRRFYRVGTPAISFVVMSSPPTLENNAQFVALAELFHEHGIGVPELLGEDPAQGWYLMTDLGESHFDDVYAAAGPDAVVPGALQTLHRLQRIHDSRVPPYTAQRFFDELGIYRDWCLSGLLGVEPPALLDDLFPALVEATQAQPQCCVHRDFHCRNLLLTPAGGIGVVDFQDALMGPAAYDLASLLRDCYYVFPEAEVARWRNEWLARTPLPVDRERFPRQFDFTAMQRQLKAVGIFARLSLRDGRNSHLGHVVPVLARVGEVAARYPGIESLAAHVNDVLPKLRHRLEQAA